MSPCRQHRDLRTFRRIMSINRAIQGGDASIERDLDHEHVGLRFGLTRVRIRGYRAARDVSVELSGTCALVGEANAGKSTLLTAMRMVLDADSPPPSRADIADGSRGVIVIDGVLADGTTLHLEARPPNVARTGSTDAFSVFYMPAELRSGPVVAGRSGAAAARGPLVEAFARPHGRHPAGASAAALTLVGAVQRLCERGCAGLVLLIEEPELYLRPQAQRYLYRLLRVFAEMGNQVVYTTDAPAFLNVGRLDELVFVRQDPNLGVRARQPRLDPPPHSTIEMASRSGSCPSARKMNGKASFSVAPSTRSAARARNSSLRSASNSVR